MEKLRVYYDREGNSLSVWFDDPKKEHVCEESDGDVVLVKDRQGRVIGFEQGVEWINSLTGQRHFESTASIANGLGGINTQKVQGLMKSKN